MRNSSVAAVSRRVHRNHSLEARKRELRLKPGKCPICGKASVGLFEVHDECNRPIALLLNTGRVEQIYRDYPVLKGKTENQIRNILNKLRDHVSSVEE